MTIAIDGTPAHGNTGGAASLAVSLTTNLTSDLIVVIAFANGGHLLSISDVAGLTWTLQGTGGTGNKLRAWTAPSPAALVADSITVTSDSGTPFITMDAFGVSGSNQTLDAAAVVGNADPLTVSTSNANTMVIGGFAETSAANPSAGAGYTKISGADFQLTEYQIFSSVQTNLSVTDGNAGDANSGIAFAIVASTSAPVPYNPWPQLGPTLAQRSRTGWTPKLVDWHRRQRPGRALLVPDRRLVLPQGFKKAA